MAYTYPYHLNGAAFTRHIRSAARPRVMRISDSNTDTSDTPYASGSEGLFGAFVRHFHGPGTTAGIIQPWSRITTEGVRGGVRFWNEPTASGRIATNKWLAADHQTDGAGIEADVRAVVPGVHLTYATGNNGGVRHQAYLHATDRAAFYGGDTFGSATNWLIGLTYMPTTFVAGHGNGTLYIQNVDNNGDVVVASYSQNINTANHATGTKIQHVSTTIARVSTNNPGIQIGVPANWDSKLVAFCGVQFECANTDGIVWAQMAQGGWAWYHLDPANSFVSEDGIDVWLGVVDPTILWFCLGTNASGTELAYTAAQWKTHIAAIIDIYRDKLITAGVTNPWIVIDVPHCTAVGQTRSADVWYNLEEAIFTLVAERMAAGENWCAINLFRAYQHSVTTYGADSVHLLDTGGDRVVNTINEILDDALADAAVAESQFRRFTRFLKM